MTFDDPSAWATAAGGGALTWFAQTVWTKVFSKEGRAYDQLIQQMSAEISSMRDRLSTVESGLDEERKLRRIAEDKVHLLELDNLQLRATLAAHGIPVPPSLTTQVKTITDDFGNANETTPN